MTQEVVEKATDVKEDAVEKVTEAVEKVSEKADEAKQKIADMTESVDPEDCLGSARDAGVPDRVLSLLDKPSDERSSIERSLVRRTLDAAGLSDMCADLTE